MNTNRILNEDAYDAINGMGFSVIDVLQLFGQEVWESNNELRFAFGCMETIDAFVELMLNQSRRARTMKEIAESSEEKECALFTEPEGI
jgi:hypothetical protein